MTRKDPPVSCASSCTCGHCKALRHLTRAGRPAIVVPIDGHTPREAELRLGRVLEVAVNDTLDAARNFVETMRRNYNGTLCDEGAVEELVAAVRAHEQATEEYLALIGGAPCAS